MRLRRHVVLKSFCALMVLAALVRQPVPCAAAEDPGGVKGVVFFDINGNGILERDEPGFFGIAVSLFGKKSDGSSLYLVTRTDAAGRFAFPGTLIGHGSNFTVSTGGAPLAAAIPTVYRPARTFYTAMNGDDKNPGTREQPYRTLGRAVPTLEAGDLLNVRQGEYREYVSSGKQSLRAGTGWDRPIVVCGMPGETVVIRPPERDLSDPLINLAIQQQQYLVFDNLVLDAEDLTQPFRSQGPDGKGPSPSHIRVINCELRNARGSAAVVAGEDHQFFNCHVHDNGHVKSEHGFSISGGHNLIQGCDIYHNSGCGICISSNVTETAGNNVLRGNRIHNNGLALVRGNSLNGIGGYGIGIHSGRKNLVYDNVIWNNPIGILVQPSERPGSDAVIHGDRGPSEELIFNNTICGSLGPGIAVASDTDTHDNVIRNNIVIGNRDPNLVLWPPYKSEVSDHNQIDGNPFFRDPKANDFHLQANSVAIDTGVAIPDVRTDHDGISRPQGKGYDRGAYEYSDDSYVLTTSAYSTIFIFGKTYPVNIGFTKKAAHSNRESKP